VRRAKYFVKAAAFNWHNLRTLTRRLSQWFSVSKAATATHLFENNLMKEVFR
jgi:hypothetical protein